LLLCALVVGRTTLHVVINVSNARHRVLLVRVELLRVVQCPAGWVVRVQATGIVLSVCKFGVMLQLTMLLFFFIAGDFEFS